MKMNIKKGDSVLVISGKDKGKSGKVLETSPKNSKVLVDGINIVTKHKKPKSQQDKGGIIKKTAPIDMSNVQVICPVCGKATRVAHKIIDGKNVRICKKCGASLDKEFAKTVKKDTKKAEKSVKKEEKVVETVKTEEKPVAKSSTTGKTVAKTTAKATTKKTATSTVKPATKEVKKAAKTTEKKSKTSAESK